jgi:hypothetical protein
LGSSSFTKPISLAWTRSPRVASKSLLGSWTRSQKSSSTKFTTEKFTFKTTKWFLVSLRKRVDDFFSFAVLLLGGAHCNGSLENQAKVWIGGFKKRWIFKQGPVVIFLKYFFF